METQNATEMSPPENARRRFLKVFIGLFSSLIGAGLAIPFVSAVIGGSSRAKAGDFSSVGSIGSLPVGTPVDIPGEPSAFYSFGTRVLFVFILQAVTGICQLFFYVPTVDHAYASLSFFRTQVPRNGSAGAWAESAFGASGGRRAGIPDPDLRKTI